MKIVLTMSVSINLKHSQCLHIHQGPNKLLKRAVCCLHLQMSHVLVIKGIPKTHILPVVLSRLHELPGFGDISCRNICLLLSRVKLNFTCGVEKTTSEELSMNIFQHKT